MLPSVPKTKRRLSEVFESALLAIQGLSNPLNLQAADSYLVILVDGLGAENIRSAAGHCRVLSQKLANSQTLFSGFPTTTASSLASFSTGLENGSHGFLGYRVYDRELGRAINLLNDLAEDLPPRKYQPAQTVSERALEAGLRPVVIGRGEYQESGFSQATMPGATYLVADSLDERFRIAQAQLRMPGNLIYLYIPELDQLGHGYGVGSDRFLQQLEELDSLVRDLIATKKSRRGIILTSDHGIIDVPKQQHIFLDNYQLFEQLELLGGDPRVGYLYFKPDTDIARFRQNLEAELGSLVESYLVQDLVQAGWLAELSPAAEKLAPDLVLLARGERVIYHRGFAKVKSLAMVGQHGGFSRSEWEVPLLIW